MNSNHSSVWRKYEHEPSEIRLRGLVTKRRNTCSYVREIYSQLLTMIVAKEPWRKIYEYLQIKIDDLLIGNVDLEKLVFISNPDGAAEQIRYIFVTENPTEKIVDPDYYLQNKDTIQINYLYYLEKQLANPIDDLLEKFGNKDVLKNLHCLLKKGAVKSATQYFSKFV